LIILVEVAFAQNQNELIRQWNEFKTHDTAYVNLSNEIAEGLNYYADAYDSALLFTDSALQVSHRLHYSYGEARAKCIKGEISISKSNFVKALDYIRQSRFLFDSLANKRGIADCILQTGIIYYTQKDYAAAISHFSQADNAYTELKDLKHVSTTRYLKALCLLGSENYSEAEQLLKETEKMKSDLGDEKGRYECHWGLADLYLRSKQFEKSKQYYKECLRYFLTKENKSGIAVMQCGIGEVYLSLNKSDSAAKYFLLALAGAKSVHYTDVMVKSTQALTSLYARKGDFEKAYAYQSEYYSIRDSLYSDETAQKIANMEAEFNISQAQSEIDFLKQLRSKDTIRFYLLVVIIVFLAVAVRLAFQRYRFKQKTNKQLQEVNDDLQSALQNLKDTQKKLVQSEKLASLGQLTAGVAHEINNPINFVSASINPLKRNFDDVRKLLESYNHLLSESNKKNSAELLKKDFDVEQNLLESDNLLQGIEEGSRRTAEIVKGLRNFSRLDAEEMKKVNIHEGIESTLPLLQSKLSQQNIEVIKSFGNIPRIDGYPGQLNQVFMNVLTNAIDAIGTKGKIFITTSKENNFVKISVRDTGTGMSEEVKQKIFDPFFTTKEVGKGTGLGLSISYGIIEKHNGRIEVKSEVGKGTEFIILLPA
jgi:signal transduction histidine kinase